MMSALAEGADQLVAGIAGELGIPTIAALPMQLSVYEASIADDAARTALQAYCDAAVLLLELPPLCDPAEPSFPERQYLQLGEFMARRSHVLLALWDGGSGETQPPLGGTGDVVRIRLQGERPHAALRGSPLFTGAASQLDVAPAGPVVQIITPRGESGALNPGRQAGDCLLLKAGGQRPFVIEPDLVFASLGIDEMHDFRQIIRLNSISPAASPSIGPPGATDPGDGPLRAPEAACLRRLWRQLEAVDEAAQLYQRKLFGEYAPGTPLRSVWADARNTWRKSRRLRRPGVLFWFAAAVPTAVFAFEIYSHFGYPYWALLVYMLTFGGAMALYHFRVRHHQWQDRFQDYRALAEALRVQVFWALSGTPLAVADSYLRKQSGQMGWMQLALRGPALWAAALGLSLPGPRRQTVIEGWLRPQIDFFLGNEERPGRAAMNRDAAEGGERWSRRFLLAGLTVAGIIFVLETGTRLLGLTFDGHEHEANLTREVLLLCAALGPALAAFFTISIEKRAYEAHGDTFELMGRIFRRALREAETPDVRASDAEFRNLMIDLGREALSENVEWLMDHRHRPIESEAG